MDSKHPKTRLMFVHGVHVMLSVIKIFGMLMDRILSANGAQFLTSIDWTAWQQDDFHNVWRKKSHIEWHKFWLKSLLVKCCSCKSQRRSILNARSQGWNGHVSVAEPFVAPSSSLLLLLLAALSCSLDMLVAARSKSADVCCQKHRTDNHRLNPQDKIHTVLEIHQNH